MWLKDSVNTGISYDNITFPLWEAVIAAGASLDEIYKVESGEYPNWFLARVIAWHQKHMIVQNHMADAQSRAADRKQRKK